MLGGYYKIEAAKYDEAVKSELDHPQAPSRLRKRAARRRRSPAIEPSNTTRSSIIVTCCYSERRFPRGRFEACTRFGAPQ